MLNRRDWLKVTGVTALASIGSFGLDAASGQAQTTGGSSYPFTLPPLPYEYDALEPFVDTETMHIHHDKHHAAYVNNLNAALANHPELAQMSVEDLIRHLDKVPDTVRTAVRNNGGGHANHSFFWQIMQKNGPGQPTGDLGSAIGKTFGSFAAFQDQFTKAALSVFGSGWAWLSLDDKKQIAIETTPNQESPWMAGRTPLVGVDVWEHAYYLKYRNVRADYLVAFYKVVAWDIANQRYQRALA